MTTEPLRLGYSKISYTKDQYAFNGGVMSKELEVSLEKKVFLRRLQLFFNVFKRERKIISQ